MIGRWRHGPLLLSLALYTSLLPAHARTLFEGPQSTLLKGTGGQDANTEGQRARKRQGSAAHLHTGLPHLATGASLLHPAFQIHPRGPLPPPSNPQPLIGILSQPGDGDGGLAPKLNHWSGMAVALEKKKRRGNEGNTSYIAASYVKWVESAGARPVPILYDEPKDVVEKKFRAINGLLIPGGGTPLDPGPFMDTLQLLLNWALEANDRGEYFPVQATCMGLEAMTIFISQNYSILELGRFNSEDNPTPLAFTTNEAKHEGLFSWMSPRLLRRVQTSPVTMENHSDGTTIDRFLSSDRLVDFFTVLTTSSDKNGTEYVSTVMGKQYPFFGTQWHPEKNAFEWGLDHIPHNADGVQVCQAAANFFVNEARRSRRAPSSSEELNDLLIYNFDPVFSGRNGEGFFEQSYVFKKPESIEDPLPLSH